MRMSDYGRNDHSENYNQKLDEIQKKLDDLQVLAMVDGDIASLSVPEITKLIEELKGGNTLQDIRQGISELNKKIEEQNEKFDKIISFVSKMYQDGEINKDTFNKLDDFLKPYHDNSNLIEDY
ncbi:MAG: hypothetical protein IIC67_11740 [Thaumarchaeota archaeon]|nr:hypothetical protein [Nitrososphaerota archaeon]